MERMYHPELDTEAPVVSYEVWEQAWKEQGWVFVEPTPEPEPEMVEVTADDVAATTEFVPSADPTAENPDGHVLPAQTLTPDAPSDTNPPDTGEEDL